MEHKRSLKAKIESGDAEVGVLGLGYVGLPVVVAFAEAGYPTLGFDVDQAVVDLISRGDSHIGDVPPSSVAAVVGSGKLRATTDFDLLRAMDIIIICVPTPLSKTGDPDVSYIVDAIDGVATVLRPGQLVILESTTYPGTTRDLVLPKLQASGLEAGSDFFLAFSPERVDPGNEKFHLKNTPKVVGGLTAECHELASAAYRRVIDTVVEVSSPEAAELTKILENTFRAVNIGLVNEMAVICDRLGIDIWEVVDAASTKPYGYMRFTPGPGLGGHCIPIDPHYLAWKMRTMQYRTRFIELAAEVNAEMPRYVVSRVAEALNAARKSVNGSRILLLGISYKRDVGDTRESPALDILELLRAQGAEVEFHDPFVPELRHDGIDLTSVDLTPTTVARTDCVVVTCDHSDIDYDMVIEQSEIIVDPRNGLEGRTGSGLVYPIAGPPRSSDSPKERSQAPLDVVVSPV
ncbi:MAG: nucleotide sugar dehydrogenase [Gemmatimonadota bacterium]|nr:nucleotide sugar dehydrogenase [Gemmatimonadota bacterium]